MFDIKEQDVTGTTNKLLFNIWQELKGLKSELPQEVKPAEEIKHKICQHCNKPHEKPVDYAICAKKFKKDGGKNE
jgi:hypothetical protein